MNRDENREIIKLPDPVFDGAVSVEKALWLRRSVRNYAATPLALAELSQLLWAAQGCSTARSFRTAPSAGALYPLEVYVVAAAVEGLSTGIYKYRCPDHALVKTGNRDVRIELFDAALRQGAIKYAPVTVIICAVYERISVKYGDRAKRYTHMEAGHASQNVYLQAQSLDLATVAIGAFHDARISKILNLDDTEYPLYLMPLGKQRQ